MASTDNEKPVNVYWSRVHVFIGVFLLLLLFRFLFVKLYRSRLYSLDLYVRRIFSKKKQPIGAQRLFMNEQRKIINYYYQYD